MDLDDEELKATKKLNGCNKIIYIYKKGDCLCKIAKKYNTSVLKICQDNRIENIDYIENDQKLIIEIGE